jgi:AcrR family transcriptional regulator
MTKSSEIVVNRSGDGQENDGKPTECRLIDALLRMWAEEPADRISVRALVQEADAAQSAIHYHFGDLERLYVEASQAALVLAEGWMADRLALLAPLAGERLAPGLQAALLADTIAGWTGGQRRLAIAARRVPGPGWERAELAFWTRIAGILGLGDHAATVACFARGEAARHLLAWNPPVDRALLDETATALVTWLAERRFAAETVRPLHRTLARRDYSEPVRGSAPEIAGIAAAAADLLAEQGHAGVTFRAVAARAQVTLGKVIHVVGTKAQLLALALHRLYEREALDDAREDFMAQTIPPQEMLGHVLEAVLGGSQPVLRAYDEIELAICNGPEFHPLRGVVRSMEDPSGTWTLTQMLGGTIPPASLVAGFSAVIRGAGFSARHAGSDPDCAARARDALAPFLTA